MLLDTRHCSKKAIDRHKRRRRPRTIREPEAEAVPFVVTYSIGLDGTEASSSYTQLWNGDKQTPMESLQFIQLPR